MQHRVPSQCGEGKNCRACGRDSRVAYVWKLLGAVLLMKCNAQLTEHGTRNTEKLEAGSRSTPTIEII